MNNGLFFIYGALSFLAGSLGALCVSRFGDKVSLVDKPNKRSAHSVPTPRGGGIGIWIAAVVVSFFAVKNIFLSSVVLSIGMLGLFEDRLGLSLKIRLSVQLVLASLVAVVFLGPPDSLSGAGLFLFWIILIAGTANLYNFMDGIDGIAGITGVTAYGFLAYYAMGVKGEPGIMLLCVCLSAACLGFLPFNLPRAKVFMGDVSSVLLGFVFAVIAMFMTESFIDLVCVLSFLFTFYADETITAVMRISRRKNLFKAHRRHYYQVLANQKNIPHWKISAGYGLSQLAIGMSVLFLRQFGIVFVLSFLALCLAGFSVMNYVARRDIDTRAKI